MEARAPGWPAGCWSKHRARSPSVLTWARCFWEVARRVGGWHPHWREVGSQPSVRPWLALLATGGVPADSSEGFKDTFGVAPVLKLGGRYLQGSFQGICRWFSRSYGRELSSEDVFALVTDAAHRGPRMLPLNRSFKAPVRAFRKVCDTEAAPCCVL